MGGDSVNRIWLGFMVSMKYAILLLLGVSAWGQTGTFICRDVMTPDGGQCVPEALNNPLLTCPRGFVTTGEIDNTTKQFKCRKAEEGNQSPDASSITWSTAGSGVFTAAATLRTGNVADHEVMMTIHGGPEFSLCSFKPDAEVNCRKLAIALLKIAPKPHAKKKAVSK